VNGDTWQTWLDANQRYMVAALAIVRCLLERHAAGAEGQADNAKWKRRLRAAERAQEEAAREMPAPPALETLHSRFALSTFERHLLVLCAGMELDATVGPLCATAQGDRQRPYPTFGLALAALPAPQWSAITPAGALRRWRLVDVEPGGLTTSAVRIEERVLNFLAGAQHLDQRLAGMIAPVPVPAGLVPSHERLAHRLAEIWSAGALPLPSPVIQLCGDDAADIRAIAAAGCHAAGVRLHMLAGDVIPAQPAEQELLRCLWGREAALGGSALLIDCTALDAADAGRVAAAGRFVDGLSGAVVVAGREPLRTLSRPAVRLDVGRPSAVEQRALWEAALGPRGAALNGHLDTIVAQFRLGTMGIKAASAGLAVDNDAELPARLWDACRAQARARLDDLAQRIEPTAAWDDLVLPEPQRQTLRDLAMQVRQRTRIYEEWGFAAKSARGLGISALFAGPSGTGKTMAAEVLAGELRLDLYRIDLSSVVSKYIGETEKNLRRVFDAAEEGGAILLFDEADALFGKRSEVKDSHDRYANIEISYLLQRMEAYRGLAILTTNMKTALDTAFLRRIRFVVQFPFPDAAQRAEIWRRVFPAGTPTDGLDALKLARLNVAGGNIRNIAMNAAFFASDAGEPVRMAHLRRAACSEFVKLEKSLTDAEIGGWV
jgi:hypothetical protein